MQKVLQGVLYYLQLLTDLNQGIYEKTLFRRLRKYVNPNLPAIDEMRHVIPPDHLSYPASWWDFWWEIFIF
jgi:hypothetical protein